jgi:hypothetical protein
MGCCGKRRKVLKGSQPTLASPLGALKPADAKPTPPRAPRRGDAGRDGAVTGRR